jgi:hypothetical protein
MRMTEVAGLVVRELHRPPSIVREPLEHSRAEASARPP